MTVLTMPCPLHHDMLARLQEETRARGWRNAVNLVCGQSADLQRYAADPREADCLHLLPDGPRRRALFLGNALGILGLLLAESFESVVTADWDADRLAFAEQRRGEEGVANLQCVAADAVGAIATRDGPFDLLVLGEECPHGRLSVPVADSRRLACLSPLVGAEGCMVYGVRFGLLRAVIDRVSPFSARGGARWYPAHARLLADAAFGTVTAYWRRPDHRPYQAYIPLHHPAAVRYWMQHAPPPDRARPRLLAVIGAAGSRLGVLAHIVSNLLIIAQRT